VKEAERLSSVLLKLADDKGDSRKRELSLNTSFPYVKAALPSNMIIPLQDALTCTLPSTPDTLKHHNPFPGGLVKIQGKPLFDIALMYRDRGPYRCNAFAPETEKAGLQGIRWQAVSIPV
jgi:hypothetical protein